LKKYWPKIFQNYSTYTQIVTTYNGHEAISFANSCTVQKTAFTKKNFP